MAKGNSTTTSQRETFNYPNSNQPRLMLHLLLLADTDPTETIGGDWQEPLRVPPTRARYCWVQVRRRSNVLGVGCYRQILGAGSRYFERDAPLEDAYMLD
jgi:hypothetical protein